MKIIILVLATFSTLTVSAQNKITPTDTLRISGKIKKELIFTLPALAGLKQTTIGDVVMLSHNGELRGTRKGLKGILLKDLLENIAFQEENRKALNRIYFIFSASDGFKLVFSRNEIFHAEGCNNFFLVTEENGKRITEIPDRISIISVDDSKNGHKQIEGVEKIMVEQAN